MPLPSSITALISALARLPGIGPRSAERIALHLVQSETGAVKQLAGARRWSLRCRDLEKQILEYLRECLTAEAGQAEFALLVH